MTPRCRHFGRCGGCTTLTTPIAEQLARKQARVREVLRPWLGAVDVTLSAPPKPPTHDRIKLLYPAAPGPHGELQLGLYELGSHRLVPIEECAIQAEALTTLATKFAATLRRFGLTPYREADRSGCVRALFGRIMPGTGELLVGVITAHELSWSSDLIAALVSTTRNLPHATREATQLVGVVHNLNPTPGNVLLGAQTTTLWGRDHQFDRVDQLTLRVSFPSFYQVHRHAHAILYRPALAMLGPVTGCHVIDGYGGVGTFALRLARAGARHVTLVEANPSACADAVASAQANGLTRQVTVQPAAFGEAPLPADAEVLLVDPPRTGLGAAAVQSVLASRVERMLYVSCSVDSLARDLAILTPTYRVVAAHMADLFPHTDHSEVLLLLARNPQLA